jgi:hypothetical protein
LPAGHAPVEPNQICIKVDGDALGNALLDISNATGSGCWFKPVPGSSCPSDPTTYPNRRSEGWFRTARLAKAGEVDFSRLPAEHLKEIRRQAMAPVWRVDAQGRCVVEEKALTKKRLGCSPDDCDAVNLAFCPTMKGVYEWMGDPTPQPRQSAQERVGIFRPRPRR